MYTAHVINPINTREQPLNALIFLFMKIIEEWVNK